MVVEAAKLPDHVLEVVFAFLELPDLQNCSLGTKYRKEGNRKIIFIKMTKIFYLVKKNLISLIYNET